MRTYPNPPEFDDAKFSVVYGRNAAPEDGGAWCRRMLAGVPTLLYPDSGPVLASAADFTAYKRDESQDEKIRRPAIRAILTKLEAGSATNAEVQNTLAKVIRYLLGELA